MGRDRLLCNRDRRMCKEQITHAILKQHLKDLKRAPGVNCPCDNYLAIKDSHKSIITDFEACYKIIKQGKHLLIVSVH